MKKKIIIASHDDRLRQALEFLFAAESDVQISGSSSNLKGLLALTQATLPDLVLLDWDLSDSSAPGVVADLKQINPAMKTIVFCTLAMAPKIQATGADEFITKGSQPDAILKKFHSLFQLSAA
ncbi:MAG TPA: hypothetical protein DEH25_11455 [Chloroflexi bacterium]|nr:hypothetical protein [Chloroflexota bacterium]HBY09316.1 hypothetical protein [Chloroflexota bacterium]